MKQNNPSTKLIAKWYKTKFDELPTSMDLKERYRIATDHAINLIRIHKKITPLTHFF